MLLFMLLLLSFLPSAVRCGGPTKSPERGARDASCRSPFADVVDHEAKPEEESPSSPSPLRRRLRRPQRMAKSTRQRLT
jgi:hypothetical protein